MIRELVVRAAKSRAVQFVVVGAVLAALAPAQREDRKITIAGANVDDARIDDEVLAREAVRIGLGTDEPVVRARLAERMRSALAQSLPPPRIEEAELDRALAEEIGRAPERMRLAVWFVSRERSGAATIAETLAREVREAKRSEPSLLSGARGAEPPEREVRADRGAGRGHGDRPPIPDDTTWTEASLASVVGPHAAEAAAKTPVGAVSDPVASAWGFWIFAPLERRPALASEVRADAAARLARERSAADIAKAVRRLRSSYDIDVRAPRVDPDRSPARDRAPTEGATN